MISEVQPKKFLYIIPYDGIGGVETAARSLRSLGTKEIIVSLLYVSSGHKGASNWWRLNNPLWHVFVATRAAKSRPYAVVSSLWRGYIIGLLVKVLRPQIKLITFLHLPNAVHSVDAALSALSMRISDQIWCDSSATATSRVPEALIGRVRIISFVTHSRQAPEKRRNRPIFVFWGRLHRQKGVLRALSLFEEICKEFPHAHYHIIGPDGGELDKIRRYVDDRLRRNVSIHGPLEYKEISQIAASASYYLQLSEAEGMAMSVVEAMQMGLVPVVTPVGEISRYCQHCRNAVLVRDGESSPLIIADLIRCDKRYFEMSEQASLTWKDHPLYADSFLDHCSQV